MTAWNWEGNKIYLATEPFFRSGQGKASGKNTNLSWHRTVQRATQLWRTHPRRKLCWPSGVTWFLKHFHRVGCSAQDCRTKGIPKTSCSLLLINPVLAERLKTQPAALGYWISTMDISVEIKFLLCRTCTSHHSAQTPLGCCHLFIFPFY